MKLTAKLVLALMVLFIIILGVDGYFSFQQEIELFENDMERDALLLGQTMQGLMAEIWRTKGQEQAFNFIESANQKKHRINIRFVWLDASSDDRFHPAIQLDRLDIVRQGQEASFKEQNSGEEAILHTYVPFEINNGKQGAIELSESFSERDQFSRKTLLKTLILIGISILACGMMAIWLGIRFVGQPLSLLNKRAYQVGQGDFSRRLTLRGRDELTELANTFNLMCDNLLEAQKKLEHETEARISMFKQLRHADRLTTVGTLASGIAHELGTPLNVIDGRAGLIVKGKLSPSEIVETANIIRSQITKMTTIIQQLLKFARRNIAQKAKVDLQHLIKETLDLLESLSRKKNTTLTCIGASVPKPIFVDPRQIQQVLTNLVINGIQAMPKGGNVEIGTYYEYPSPPQEHTTQVAKYLCFYVQDEGYGIPSEDQPYIFDPFFTTKEIGDGTGLGLSIVHGIVQEHGGWIEVISEPGQGSRFLVHLPLEPVI